MDLRWNSEADNSGFLNLKLPEMWGKEIKCELCFVRPQKPPQWLVWLQAEGSLVYSTRIVGPLGPSWRKKSLDA